MNEFLADIDFDILHKRRLCGTVRRAVLDEPPLQRKLEEYRRQFAN